MIKLNKINSAASDAFSVPAVPAAADDTRAEEDDLCLESSVKCLSMKQKKIRSDVTRVGRDMLGIIKELEKLKGDFDELSCKCRNTSENFPISEDRRKQITPVKDLGEATEIRKINDLIKKQGFKVAEFIEGMNIANRTFYQKVEKHLFTMKELNYLRDVLSLTDDEFVKLFFS